MWSNHNLLLENGLYPISIDTAHGVELIFHPVNSCFVDAAFLLEFYFRDFCQIVCSLGGKTTQLTVFVFSLGHVFHFVGQINFQIYCGYISNGCCMGEYEEYTNLSNHFRIKKTMFTQLMILLGQKQTYNATSARVLEEIDWFPFGYLN